MMKWLKGSKNMSLNQRLGMLVGTSVIPMMVLLVYLLVSMVNFCNDYDQIIVNIRYANEYYRDFKKDINGSIYLAVIGSITFDELGKEQNTVEPYSYIEGVKENCDRLMELATSSQSRRQVVRMHKALDTLADRIKDIESNLSGSERAVYQDNVELLENSVYILSEIIEDRMREYIYQEASNFAAIQEELMVRQNFAVQLSVTALLVIIVLTLVIAWRISNSVTTPIKQLCDVAAQAAKGDFTARADFKTDDEISVLTNSFNHMTGEIGRLVDDIKVEQENLRITESKLMQAQINPHFLYNTLDTIVWLAEEKQTEDVVSVVTSLSDFFRAMLSDGRDYVAIREEEKHVRSYLEIQQFRYQDILEYDIQIDADLYEYIIPKLMLQPLVENALYHGIKNKRGMGKITIRGYKREDEIIFEVIDNGIGLNKVQLDKLNTMKVKEPLLEETKRTGFGIANVRERITHYYGQDYGLIYESEEGVGTKAVITIPVKNIQPFS